MGKRILLTTGILMLIGVVIWCSVILGIRSHFQPYTQYDEENFVLLGNYRVFSENHTYLGKKENGGGLYNIWELEGLPVEEFVYITGGLYGGVEEVMMHKTVSEPLLRYPVNKMEVIDSQRSNGIENTVIEDLAIITPLIDLCKTASSTRVETVPSGAWVLRLYFDLPCQLVCDLWLYQNSDGEMTLYMDDVSGNTLAYSVTHILQGVLK